VFQFRGVSDFAGARRYLLSTLHGMDWYKRALSPTPRIGDPVDGLIVAHDAQGLEPSYVRIKEDLGRELGRELNQTEKNIVTKRLRESSSIIDRARRGDYVAAMSALHDSVGTDAWDEKKEREGEAWDKFLDYKDSVLQGAKRQGDEPASEATIARGKDAIARAKHLGVRDLRFERNQLRAIDEPSRRAAVVAVGRALTASQKRGGRTRRGRKTRKTRKGRKGRKGRTYKGRKGRRTRR